MERIVMKFGGTSVANPEKIAQAAKRVAQEVRARKQVAVIVSAMGKTTDELLTLAREVKPESGTSRARYAFDDR